MSKYHQAARHGFASVIGWFRVFFANPAFACALFKARWTYFAHRRFEKNLATPDGLVFETPDALIAYWAISVERELHHDRWTRALKVAKNPLVVDVGANAGIFSHMIFGLNPSVEIIAFEPLPAMHGRLESLKKRTRMNLRLIPKAVGRTTGEALLESPHGYDGISHICDSGEAQGNTIPVAMTTLDNELAGRDILLMKMDVEGYECEVIAGAARTLARTKFLIIEAQTDGHRDAITLALGDSWRRRKLTHCDYLFYRA
jgi:FkbM family methyltransferase